MQYLGAISKMTESSLYLRQTIQYTVIQVYAPTTNAKEAEVERFYDDLQKHHQKRCPFHHRGLECKSKEAEVEWFYDDLQKQHQKRCPFHHRGLECKSRKSRDTWTNRQFWPWSTEWSTNRNLPRQHTGHSQHTLPTTQETTLHVNIIRWAILNSDWLNFSQQKMEKLYTVSKNKNRSWLWLRSWTPYCKFQT